MNATNRIRGALLAQVLAQALTAWALVLHFLVGAEASLLHVVMLIGAGVVALRHDGSFRDRATSNFGAALLTASALWWNVIMGSIDGITGNGPWFTPDTPLLLVAAVLFSVAGGLFWTTHEGGER